MNKMILLFTTIVALSIDLCFFHYIPNLSVLIFVLTLNSCYLTMFKNSFKIGLNIETLISVTNTAISASYFIFNQKELRLINFWVILILSLAQLLIIFKKSKYEWHNIGFVPEVLGIIVTKSLRFISQYFCTVSEAFKDLLIKNISNKSNLRKVLLGLIMVLPILVVVTFLLASSDLVFSNVIKNFTKIFEFIEVDSVVYHSILVFALSLPIFSIVYYMASKGEVNTNGESNRDRELEPKAGTVEMWKEKNDADSEESPIGPIRIGKKTKFGIDPVMLITALGAINFVYIMFVVIQFSYLFGHNGSMPFGLNHAEYARKGFFELVAVTIINLSIFLFGTYFESSEGDGKGGLSSDVGLPSGNKLSLGIKLLNGLMIFCTFVMLLSAHTRMNIYQENYGFTFLRLYTHFFMAFICILLVLSLVRLFKKDFMVSAAYIIVSMCFCLLINYVNIDGMVAKNYIERYDVGKTTDLFHLVSLSADSDIYLLEILKKYGGNKIVLKNPGLTWGDYQEIASHLTGANLSYKYELSHWQSFNLGKYWFMRKYMDIFITESSQ